MKMKPEDPLRCHRRTSLRSPPPSGPRYLLLVPLMLLVLVLVMLMMLGLLLQALHSPPCWDSPAPHLTAHKVNESTTKRV